MAADRLRAGIVAAMLVLSCAPEVDLTGPFESTLLRVYVKNETMAAFNLQGNVVDVGRTGFDLSYGPTVSSPSPPFDRFFDISRGGVPTARVTYRVLRFPDRGVVQDVTITVAEPSGRQFTATTADTAWIAIVGIQPL